MYERAPRVVGWHAPCVIQSCYSNEPSWWIKEGGRQTYPNPGETVTVYIIILTTLPRFIFLADSS